MLKYNSHILSNIQLDLSSFMLWNSYSMESPWNLSKMCSSSVKRVSYRSNFVWISVFFISKARFAFSAQTQSVRSSTAANATGTKQKNTKKYVTNSGRLRDGEETNTICKWIPRKNTHVRLKYKLRNKTNSHECARTRVSSLKLKTNHNWNNLTKATMFALKNYDAKWIAIKFRIWTMAFYSIRWFFFEFTGKKIKQIDSWTRFNVVDIQHAK